jgi:hypothetical protein
MAKNRALFGSVWLNPTNYTPPLVAVIEMHGHWNANGVQLGMMS